MVRRLILTCVGIAVLLVAGCAVEAQLGSTSYSVNGIRYSVPHKYEFTRNFRLPWLENIRGLEPEPEHSIWLLLPADELARDVPGYSKLFHGYAAKEPADMVVNVLGGAEAREFPDDLKRRWEQIRDFEREGARREADPTGWERVISIDGVKGTPGEGHLNFDLVATPEKPMPRNWLPPSCLASPDIDKRETYYCNFTILENGRTFDFSLRRENLALADRIPAYIMRRLDEWK